MYDTFRTIAQAKKAYRRCRTAKHFILKDDTPNNPTCPVCTRKLKDDPETMPGYRGNRCEYNPRTKQVTVFHYTCSWKRTFTQIANLGAAA
jgi:tRNA(Ile2) C34 agmatinyltransferase TiaS